MSIFINDQIAIHLSFVFRYVFHFYLNVYNILVENLEGKGSRGRSGVDGRLIIKKVLKEIGFGYLRLIQLVP